MTLTHYAGRVPSFFQVGTVVPDGSTVQAAYDAAGLSNWNVRKVQLTATDLGPNGVTSLEIPGQFAVVRDSEIGVQYIGEKRGAVVGPDYKVVQNEETAEVLAAIVDAGDLKVETVGALNGGATVFTTVAIPDGIEIAGDDPLDLFLLAKNSNDGSGAFGLFVTPIRPICTNTLNLAVKGARQSYRIRHTSNVRERIAQAREALKVTFTYRDAFAAEVERLLATEVTKRQFESIIEGLIPVNEEAETARAKGFANKARQERDTLRSLFVSSPTTEAGRGTAWAAYNAVTEYADWYLPIKGKDADGTRRAERALLTQTVDTFKTNGVRLLEKVTA